MQTLTIDLRVLRSSRLIACIAIRLEVSVCSRIDRDLDGAHLVEGPLSQSLIKELGLVLTFNSWYSSRVYLRVRVEARATNHVGCMLGQVSLLNGSILPQTICAERGAGKDMASSRVPMPPQELNCISQ